MPCELVGRMFQQGWPRELTSARSLHPLFDTPDPPHNLAHLPVTADSDGDKPPRKPKKPGRGYVESPLPAPPPLRRPPPWVREDGGCQCAGGALARLSTRRSGRVRSCDQSDEI